VGRAHDPYSVLLFSRIAIQQGRFRLNMGQLRKKLQVHIHVQYLYIMLNHNSRSHLRLCISYAC
jgi:hypothetical protein